VALIITSDRRECRQVRAACLRHVQPIAHELGQYTQKFGRLWRRKKGPVACWNYLVQRAEGKMLPLIAAFSRRKLSVAAKTEGDHFANALSQEFHLVAINSILQLILRYLNGLGSNGFRGLSQENLPLYGPFVRIRDYMRKTHKGIFCVVASQPCPACGANAFRSKIYRDARLFTAVKTLCETLMEDFTI